VNQLYIRYRINLMTRRIQVPWLKQNIKIITEYYIGQWAKPSFYFESGTKFAYWIFRKVLQKTNHQTERGERCLNEFSLH